MAEFKVQRAESARKEPTGVIRDAVPHLELGEVSITKHVSQSESDAATQFSGRSPVQ